MNKKKLLIWIIAAAVCAGAAVGIGFAVKASASPAIVVPAGSIEEYFWWAEDVYLEGQIVSDATQEVYLNSTDTVKSVNVHEGDAVKKGDILMVYDTEQVAVDLKKEEIALDKIQLSIDIAEENIKKLKNTSPVSEYDDSGYYEEVFEEEDLEEEDGGDMVVYAKLDEKSVPVNADDVNAGRGVSPFLYLVEKDVKISPAFLNTLRIDAILSSRPQWIEFVCEDEEEGTYTMRLNPVDLPKYEENTKTGSIDWESQRITGLDEVQMAGDDQPAAKPDKPVTPDKPDDPGQTEDPDTPDDPGQQEDPDTPEGEDPETTGEDTDTQGWLAPILKVSVNPVAGMKLGAGKSDILIGDLEYTAEELKKALSEEEYLLETLQLDYQEQNLKVMRARQALEEGSVKAKFDGIVLRAGDPEKMFDTWESFLTVTGKSGLYVKGALSESMLQSVQPGQKISVTSWNSGTTCEATIAEIEMFPTEGMYYGDYNESYYPFTATFDSGMDSFENQEWVEIVLKKDNAGGSTAQTDEPASEAPEEEAPSSEVPEEEAPSSEVPEAGELSSGDMPADDMLTDDMLTDDMPADDMLTDDMLMEDMSAEDAASDTSLHIWKAFIREENGNKYVYVRNDKQRIEKRYISVGKLSQSCYEIKDGITEDDWIAFPYGVKEGAKAIEGSMDDLY